MPFASFSSRWVHHPAHAEATGQHRADVVAELDLLLVAVLVGDAMVAQGPQVGIVGFVGVG